MKLELSDDLTIAPLQRCQSLQAFIVPEKSVTKISRMAKFENLPRDITPRVIGPWPPILPLHLPYLKDQVWYKFHRSRTTNVKVVKQNAL